MAETPVGTVEADDDDRKNQYITFEMPESNYSVSFYCIYAWKFLLNRTSLCGRTTQRTYEGLTFHTQNFVGMNIWVDGLTLQSIFDHAVCQFCMPVLYASSILCTCFISSIQLLN